MTEKKELNKLEEMMIQKNVSDAELKALIDQIKNPIIQNQTQIHYWSNKHTKIGLVGDTHIGSKYADYGAINDIFKRFQKAGVDAIYLTGDLTEGDNRRKGHSYELELHGADDQITGVVERIPKIGKPIYFITGDHDHWHFESAGVDVGKWVETQRDDMHYLGMFNAEVEFAKKSKIMLLHPAKGTAYALSYHPQKIAEALSGGEKPNILAIGHFHKIEYLFYRNIHIFQTGTLEKQTPWMKRMNLSAHLGGWIIDIYHKKDGSIDKLTQTLIPYY